MRKNRDCPTKSGTVCRSARSANLETCFILEGFMMEVISSDAIFKGKGTEVPKSAFVDILCINSVQLLFLCSYKIAGHFHDLVGCETYGKKTGLVGRSEVFIWSTDMPTFGTQWARSFAEFIFSTIIDVPKSMASCKLYNNIKKN